MVRRRSRKPKIAGSIPVRAFLNFKSSSGIFYLYIHLFNRFHRNYKINIKIHLDELQVPEILVRGTQRGSKLSLLLSDIHKYRLYKHKHYDKYY